MNDFVTLLDFSLLYFSVFLLPQNFRGGHSLTNNSAASAHVNSALKYRNSTGSSSAPQSKNAVSAF